MSPRIAAALFTALVAVAIAAAAPVHADITTERSASILVWPKIIANGTRDTIIQITNTSNSMVKAHCFYVNAQVRGQGIVV